MRRELIERYWERERRRISPVLMGTLLGAGYAIMVIALGSVSV